MTKAKSIPKSERYATVAVVPADSVYDEWGRERKRWSIVTRAIDDVSGLKEDKHLDGPFASEQIADAVAAERALALGAARKRETCAKLAKTRAIKMRPKGTGRKVAASTMAAMVSMMQRRTEDLR